MQAPRAALVFALVIALVPVVRGNFEELEHSGDTTEETERPNEVTTSSIFAAVTATETLTANINSTNIAPDENQLEFILMVLIPLILLVVLLLSVVFLATYYKRKRTKQDELGNENVKVPIFEEDTPSVMEIEMEELDKWMNSMNRNADYECLPTLKEEKESNHNPSDNES
ncbi:transmembrane protein 154 isoform X3 [Trachypithecus francoisi]|uniref:transmembrane protein 154 isoform X3 n=1 Tax=Trachypithecus francoisi TaxID=54180 RepID=UPI00141A6E98|nr:transmembrane protein 154 isoform X3 [Trachypithecus francoisi]